MKIIHHAKVNEVLYKKTHKKSLKRFHSDPKTRNEKLLQQQLPSWLAGIGAVALMFKGNGCNLFSWSPTEDNLPLAACLQKVVAWLKWKMANKCTKMAKKILKLYEMDKITKTLSAQPCVAQFNIKNRLKLIWVYVDGSRRRRCRTQCADVVGVHYINVYVFICVSTYI